MLYETDGAGRGTSGSVAFTRELYKVSGGDVGILYGFHQVGPVDIAWINYPLRANTNDGLLFVNGQPRILNVEDLKLLDQNAMQQDPQFQNTKAQFPTSACGRAIETESPGRILSPDERRTAVHRGSH